MPYYDYAYDSVRIIRGLCQQTRNLWINEQDVILRMFEKQTISIEEDQPIDENTIRILKRGDRYKLFKLDIVVDSDNKDRFGIFCQMLDEMPEFEISMIYVRGDINKLINTLSQKPNFETQQDLFNVLDFHHLDPPKQSEPYEYLRRVQHPEKHDMS